MKKPGTTIYGMVAAHEPGDTLTLGALRQLLENAATLPPETVVRVTSVPFKFDDLGNPAGLSARSVALTKD